MSGATHVPASSSDPSEETQTDRPRTWSGRGPRPYRKSRSTRDIPAATMARISGRRLVMQFEFVDHHGSGCSDGSLGWFFSCRSESWDEAYAVRRVEPEFDTYLAFENPRHRPSPPMTERTKAKLRGGDRNRMENGCGAASRRLPLVRTRSTPSGRSGPVKALTNGSVAP